MLWSSIPKRWGCSKFYQQVKKSLYNWILQNIQVVVSPISNYCLKLSIDGQVKPQLVPKLLFHVSFRELNNSMVSSPEEGGIKEAIDSDNNIIISDSTLRNILPPQLKNTTSWYKVMCGCECFVSTKSMHYSLLTTCSSPRRPLFLHALSFECTSKLCITFLNQFSVYFHIKRMHNTI